MELNHNIHINVAFFDSWCQSFVLLLRGFSHFFLCLILQLSPVQNNQLFQIQ